MPTLPIHNQRLARGTSKTSVGSDNYSYPSSSLNIGEPTVRRNRSLLHNGHVVTFGVEDDVSNVTATVSTKLRGSSFISDHDAGPASKRWSLTRCLSCMVLLEAHHTRRLYETILAVLLIYTGTIFPYRLCFYDFRVPEPKASQDGWQMTEAVVDVLFILDLVINFFLSYRDARGMEVSDLKRIWINYLKCYFWINALACMPPELVSEMLTAHEEEDNNVNNTAKITRLQRVSRLARLVRLLRLLKVVPIFARSAFMARLRSKREVRLLHLGVHFVWIMHLVACGWYLVAYLHKDSDETWVARRELPSGDPLLGETPEKHWLHAMYFVLTVFTTVGFGDMSAYTIGEIGYVTLTMLVGNILNSIIMSEMIGIIMGIDAAASDVQQKKELVKSFAERSDLSGDAVLMITKVLSESRSARTQFSSKDVEEIGELLMGGLLPPALTMDLPEMIFQGRLIRNRFIVVLVTHSLQIPLSFILSVSVALTQQHFNVNDLVYRCHEHPANLYLVIEGIFAAVARTSPEGGSSEPPPTVVSAITEMQRAASSRRLNGSLDRGARSFHLPRESDSGGGDAGESRQVQPVKSSKDGEPGRMSLMQRLRRSSTRKSRKSTLKSPLSGPPTQESPGSTPWANRRFDVKLYPYKFYSYGSYFGDLELIFNGPRRFSVRCESGNEKVPDGVVLALHKPEFTKLLQDYPQYGAVWRKAAARQEVMRTQLIQKLTRGMSYRHYAAWLIQQKYRDTRLRQSRISRRSLGLPRSSRPSQSLRSSSKGSMETKEKEKEKECDKEYVPFERANSSGRLAEPPSSTSAVTRERAPTSHEALQQAKTGLYHELCLASATQESLHSSIDNLRNQLVSMNDVLPSIASSTLPLPEIRCQWR